MSQVATDKPLSNSDCIAKVVWKIITDAVNQATQGERVFFILAGLSADALEGIARKTPRYIERRSLLLRMNRQVASGLEVNPEILTEESATHWRHNKSAEVIIFAASDEERESIGAGLGSVSRIDEPKIVDQIDYWLDFLDEVGEAKNYFENALKGLCKSKIYFDLHMWVDFIQNIRAQGFAHKAHVRIKRAMPSLKIPKDGIMKLPAFKIEGNPNAKIRDFVVAFRNAESEVRPYATLLTPKQERVDIGEVRKKLEEFPSTDDSEVLEALDAVRALLDDADNIRPGDWRKSQDDFCKLVSWERVGANLFKTARRTLSKKLGERTLNFIQGNHADEVTDDDIHLLENLDEKVPREPLGVEVEFFNRWKLYLSHPDETRLFKAWHKRLFSKEVMEHDLLSALEEGFEALIAVAGESFTDMQEPRILVRATQHNKARFWESLDQQVHKLFCFELKTVSDAFAGFVRWDLDYALKFESTNDSKSSEKRKVDLELYLVKEEYLSNLGNNPPPNNAPRVKVTWQPGKFAKDEPISLALVDDIKALAKVAENGDSLFRKLEFSPRSIVGETRSSSTCLSDRNSFNDVTQNQQGRTFDDSVKRDSEDDILFQLSSKIDEIKDYRTLAAEEVQVVCDSVVDFKEKYRKAIILLSQNTQKAFSSMLLDEQAQAFGAMCKACLLHPNAGEAGREIRLLLAQIGVISSASVGPMAILAAWHPLRLAERRAKVFELAGFVSKVLESCPARKADLSTTFQVRRHVRNRWVFPEVVFLNEETMISVEDVAGYSLMVPAKNVARSQEALEVSTTLAAEKFMEGVDQYLEINPHEAANLSVAIFDSESQTLPLAVAKEMAKRLHRRPELRCELVITHRDQESMRKIYRHQNLRLKMENISEGTRGFLSRLRVDVRSNSSSEENIDSVRDLDLVLLHEVISQHASPNWTEEAGSSDTLAEKFDTTCARYSRQRNIGPNSNDSVGIYLTLPNPPRAVSNYQNILYELTKKGFLPKNYHGILIQEVKFSAPHVRDLIHRSHQLAEWVVTYDKVVSRGLLAHCQVQIINDISVPGSEGRVILSAWEVRDQLKQKVKEVLIDSCGINADKSKQLTEKIINDVLKISGQKVLSASRYFNAAREMIGLVIMRAWIEAGIKASLGIVPVWLSLDDHRSWFMSGKSKVADAIAVAMRVINEEFEIYLLVGEAKFVEQESEFSTLKAARQQVQITVDRLKDLLIDNDDTISRTATCTRLFELLVNCEDVGVILPSFDCRQKFFSALREGKVIFRISGEAIVSLHDKHEHLSRVQPDEGCPYIRCRVLTTPDIRQTLYRLFHQQNLEHEEIGDIHWYDGTIEPNTLSPLIASHPERNKGSSYTESENLHRKRTISTVGGVIDNTIEEQKTIPKKEVPLEQNQVSRNEIVKPQFLPPQVYEVLLDMASKKQDAIDGTDSIKWAEDVSVEVQRSLSHFGMQAEFADPKLRLTPNGVLVGFRGHHTLTIEKIEKRISEMLTTYGIEVVDVRPSRGKISVFVKREKRARVSLASIWLNALWPNRPPGSSTSFIIGAREDSDDLLYLNLAGAFSNYEEHGPHTLIAGETGSGKGILTQTLLLQLIAFNDPAEAEVIVVDPKKGVDFVWLDGAPQMKRPIISEVSDAQSILDSLVHEMDERYQKFKERRVPNITEYNRNVLLDERMSRIFLVHDELGAWMAQDKKYQEVVLSSVSNLGMKARAAGIHLVLITQRADVDAVPGRLRDNMGNRLCLKVQNVTGSKMVLGVGGAEKLLGKGHLSCILANESQPTGQKFFVVQVPFAEPEDVSRLAEAAKSYWVQKRS